MVLLQERELPKLFILNSEKVGSEEQSSLDNSTATILHLTRVYCLESATCVENASGRDSDNLVFNVGIPLISGNLLRLISDARAPVPLSGSDQ